MFITDPSIRYMACNSGTNITLPYQSAKIQVRPEESLRCSVSTAREIGQGRKFGLDIVSPLYSAPISPLYSEYTSPPKCVEFAKQ